MGGLNWTDGDANGWQDVNEDEVTQAVKRAVDKGVNHFDTADIYGNGDSERMLNRVLRRLGLKSEDFIIATKMGHLKGSAGHAYEPLHIRHQCEQSLMNLGRDHIDLYYFHRGKFGEDNEYLDGAVDTMLQLVKGGKVRLTGLSAYSAEDFQNVVPVLKPTVIQSWANLLDDRFIRDGSAVRRLLAEYQISFIAFSPLAQGLLLNKYDPNAMPHFAPGDHRREHEAFQPRNVARVSGKLARLSKRWEGRAAFASVALRYILNHPNIATVIPGFRNQEHVECNLRALEQSLSEEDMCFLRDLFWIDPCEFAG